MLEKLDLTLSLSKEDYKARLPGLQQRLFELQLACWKNGAGSLLVFEGWQAAGVGGTLNLLTQKLEPRGFRLHAIREPRTYETHMPWLWRFWRCVPNYGQLAIFDKSWYRRVVDERVDKVVSKREWQQASQDIADFERTLSDDGYAILKFFFHITKKEQKKRFQKMEKDPLAGWHAQPVDWLHNREYDKYLEAVEDMLQKTDSEWAPWTLVEATDRRWARIKVLEAVARTLEAALEKRGVGVPAPPPSPEEPAARQKRAKAVRRS